MFLRYLSYTILLQAKPYYRTLRSAKSLLLVSNPLQIVLTTESTILLCCVNGDPVKKHLIPYSSKNYCTSLPLNDLSPSPLILGLFVEFLMVLHN
ncbi:MAG: hypothetical protein EZS28_045719 [Streblomastix strix]|uniref:Uncharacterized protein n=1 Tax=Streblomastix strix TaxID=222440 RepID=A0A5J4TK69_9EUKA|nr:MAG: hypothetical protein EZS28_045719 [Streblomastix strix]